MAAGIISGRGPVWLYPPLLSFTKSNGSELPRIVKTKIIHDAAYSSSATTCSEPRSDRGDLHTPISSPPDLIHASSGIWTSENSPF
jgi:hypothetical protein